MMSEYLGPSSPPEAIQRGRPRETSVGWILLFPDQTTQMKMKKKKPKEFITSPVKVAFPYSVAPVLPYAKISLSLSSGEPTNAAFIEFPQQSNLCWFFLLFLLLLLFLSSSLLASTRM
jgi:hypothetical protein